MAAVQVDTTGLKSDQWRYWTMLDLASAESLELRREGWRRLSVRVAWGMRRSQMQVDVGFAATEAGD